ncbi:T9SS C-terminal target domain-containing protein [Chryseobacterium indologenes]|uniref:T9SS C-terminal target domain-containing protein n=1 Tax=Chryseobacterium indologenes TaxID=253 RepID=A0AAD1DWD4_CHRID|nr:T9SS type A sorting domain-containing protein [Chryseobacterium indologenes]AZB18177.1 T9SS C-terminal target domain-containing protein [Chryseobacterium indologenes]
MMYPDLTFTTNCRESTRALTPGITGKKIRFFPNAVKDNLFVNADSPIQNIQLTDTQQRIVFDQNFNEDTAKINISNYPTGVYIIRVITNKNQVTEKIITK